MGLIRSALNIQTAGLVRDSSKKQRVAKQTLASLQAQERMMLMEMSIANKMRAALNQPGARWRLTSDERARFEYILRCEIEAGRG